MLKLLVYVEVISIDSKLVVRVPKGDGDYLGNLLRKVVLTSVKSLRPVGFLIRNDNSTNSSLVGSDDIVEDMFMFSSKLSGLRFSLKTENPNDVYIMTYTFFECLNSDDLSKGDIVCDTKGVELLHCVGSSSTTITIIYRYCSGCNTTTENRDAVTEFLGVANAHKYTFCRFISSRHSCVDSFSFKTKAYGEDECLEINIDSNFDAKDVVLSSCNRILDSINDVIHSIS